MSNALFANQAYLLCGGFIRVEMCCLNVAHEKCCLDMLHFMTLDVVRRTCSIHFSTLQVIFVIFWFHEIRENILSASIHLMVLQILTVLFQLERYLPSTGR